MALSISGDKHIKTTDEKLLEQFLSSGDIDLLGALYKRYMPLVYGVCLKYLKNRDDAQDAVISIFEKLVSEVRKHSIQNFRPWLYVLAKNFCLMELRSAGSERLRMKKFTDESEAFMENGESMHPIDKEDSQIDRALAECIEKLKAEQRECVNLFYYKNKCYREIASLLKLDELKVKSHLQNAKRNLKLCLESVSEYGE